MNSKIVFCLFSATVSLATYSAYGESFPIGEHPTYHDGTLTIPLVDTPEQSGAFQDVVLRLTEQGDWRLLDFKASGTAPLIHPVVETVGIVVTDSFPIQVFLKVNGAFANPCTEMGKTSQRMEGKRFEVTMSAEYNLNQTQYGCVAALAKFEKIIPLPVYGLDAGVYEYSLGGVVGVQGAQPTTFTGTFELARDNVLSCGLGEDVYGICQ